MFKEGREPKISQAENEKKIGSEGENKAKETEEVVERENDTEEERLKEQEKRKELQKAREEIGLTRPSDYVKKLDIDVLDRLAEETEKKSWLQRRKEAKEKKRKQKEQV